MARYRRHRRRHYYYKQSNFRRNFVVFSLILLIAVAVDQSIERECSVGMSQGECVDYLESIFGGVLNQIQSLSLPEIELPAISIDMPDTQTNIVEEPSEPNGSILGSDIDYMERRIFEMTNEVRKSVGVHELMFREHLGTRARSHSERMINENFFEHGNIFERAENIGEVPITHVPGLEIVEGCVITFTDEQIASCFMDGWINSPGHYSNMVNPTLHSLGVGVACDGFICRATQNFG